jgi:hypothetical protein
MEVVNMLMGTEVKDGTVSGFGVVRGDHTTVQEGNWEGLVLQTVFKILFHQRRIYAGTDKHLHFRDMKKKTEL